MTRKTYLLLTLLYALAFQCLPFQSLQVFAQVTVIDWQGGGADNNWLTSDNWAHSIPGALPTGRFGEAAAIAGNFTVLVDADFGTAIPASDGPPGELQVSGGAMLEITGAGRFTTELVNPDPSVDGSVQFTSGGVLSIEGPSAGFESSSLSFNGGQYSPVITGANHGLIEVSGGINLIGGVLAPEFAFAPAAGAPAAGDSWTLAEAASITGEFILDQSQVGLPTGLVARASVVSGGPGQQLVLDLASTLVLTINTDDGSASISNPLGGAVDITGYGISSGSGQLIPASWSSFADQAVPGWFEAGSPTPNRLDEIAGPTGGSTVGSQSISASPTAIGNPFTIQPFQSTSEDLSFEYVTATGELLEGAVVYEGLNVVNNLLLTVDPMTGNAELTNSSQTTIDLYGYSILSESGSLDVAAWSSLDDQGVGSLQEAGPDSTDLSELAPLPAGALTLSPGDTFSLGGVFNTAGTQDLQLEFLTGATAIPGDFDADGDVDGQDFLFWQRNDGSADSLEDWRANFGQTGGGLGFEILDGVVLEGPVPSSLGATSAAVPEPSSLTVLLALLFTSASCRRRF